MMGRLNRDQGQLFYCFNLEEAVPEDHLVRAIATGLDLSWVHAELAPHYSPIVARALAKTNAYAQSRHDRKKVEMLFAHLKRILRLVRLRLRGPSGAQFEFTLAAIAQNLRRLAKLSARLPPDKLLACVA